MPLGLMIGAYGVAMDCAWPCECVRVRGLGEFSGGLTENREGRNGPGREPRCVSGQARIFDGGALGILEWEGRRQHGTQQAFVRLVVRHAMHTFDDRVQQQCNGMVVVIEEGSCRTRGAATGNLLEKIVPGNGAGGRINRQPQGSEFRLMRFHCSSRL